MKKLGKTSKLQKELLKTQINQDEVYSDTWRDKKSEWLDYVKIGVLCTFFSYALKAMEEITGFGMKDCLSLPSLGWKYFFSLRTEEDDSKIPIMTNKWDGLFDRVLNVDVYVLLINIINERFVMLF